jgi:hypothetical protein
MKIPPFRLFPLALTGLIALLLVGCTSDTKVAKSEVSANAAPLHFSKVYILALSNDDFNRRLAEVKLKEEVTAVPTVAGYEMLPDITDLRNKEKVIQSVKDSGADGLVVLRVTAQDEKVTTNATNQRPMDYQIFSDYYGAVYDAGAYFSNESRSIGLDRIFTIETRIFDAKTGKLIWTGQTVSTKNNLKDRDVRGLMEEVAAAVRGELRSHGLIR